MLKHFDHVTVAVTAPAAARLDRIGFNHICFAVSNIDDLIAKVTAAGTVELADWKQPS